MSEAGNLSPEIQQEIVRRRTFAIISHPDAGKTTLTEKLLLYGGAIQRAGMVTQKANRHQTVSDWMEMEQRRGISISSTALQFDYNDVCYNLLDTPGHQDFSEDTYRTLLAVDSAIMLLDAAKGVEPQTVKLFKVCRERGIPIFTIINKMDRPSLNPFELLEEVEKVLGILAIPMTWPIGEPGDFKGVFERSTRQVHLYERTSGGQWKAPVATSGLDDPAMVDMISQRDRTLLDEELEMVDELIHPFETDLFLEGEMTPVFFACAINNFGLDNFLDRFTELAPHPADLRTVDGEKPAASDEFSGFVYKIQANMNKAHRDRVAFMRVATGKFEKNMSVKHLRSGKKVKLSFPYRLFGQKREIIEEAYPGDIVGLVNPGLFRAGDLLAVGKDFQIPSFPRFPPEIFCRIRLRDMTHNKSFRKGLDQLGEEGVVQVFYDPRSHSRMPVIAAVGELQLEVFKERMLEEYRCEVTFDRLDYSASRWIKGEVEDEGGYTFTLLYDEAERPVALFRNEWHMNQVVGNHEDLEFLPHPPDFV